MDIFAKFLSVAAEELEFELRGYHSVPWAEFLLNPRRLRGSDFLMRWSQGVWSEERVLEAVNETQNFLAIPYGPSGTAPDDDPRAFELYFERLEQAGLAGIKRPDILMFRKADRAQVEEVIEELGGLQELPFISEDTPAMEALLEVAILAVECENSLWRAQRMPHYGAQLRPMRRLGGQPGLPKGAVLPTIIIKEEDRLPLSQWQTQRGLQIHIWYVFFDMAFGISFARAEELIATGLIEPTEQVFQAPGGATTRKVVYKIYYHYGYPLGQAHSEPTLLADYIADNNGHILPYVRFQGGRLTLAPEAIQILEQVERAHRL